jgi:hypothetical protein
MLGMIMLASAGLPLAFAQGTGGPTGPQSLETTPVTIVRADGERLDFSLELANEPEEISTGLMFRDSLPERGGMIFDFGAPRVTGMWMLNTRIPLDMLFVDETGLVVAVAHETVPHSTRSVSAGVRVKSVIELAGGQARALGLAPGDRVEHPMFGTVAR